MSRCSPPDSSDSPDPAGQHLRFAHSALTPLIPQSPHPAAPQPDRRRLQVTRGGFHVGWAHAAWPYRFGVAGLVLLVWPSSSGSFFALRRLLPPPPAPLQRTTSPRIPRPGRGRFEQRSVGEGAQMIHRRCTKDAREIIETERGKSTGSGRCSKDLPPDGGQAVMIQGIRFK